MYIYLFLFSQFCLQKTNQLGNAIKMCILTAIKKGIHQTIQKNSVGFILWDEITMGKD